MDHVKVKLISGRYHRSNEKGSISIPLYLFYTIVSIQTALNELHQQAKLYANPIKEKPFTKERNHRNFENEVEPIVVQPGEIVTFD